MTGISVEIYPEAKRLNKDANGEDGLKVEKFDYAFDFENYAKAVRLRWSEWADTTTSRPEEQVRHSKGYTYL